MDIVLLVLAAICFAIAGLGPVLGIQSTKIHIGWLGLLFWVLTLLPIFE